MAAQLTPRGGSQQTAARVLSTTHIVWRNLGWLLASRQRAVAQGCTVRAGLVYEEPPNQADDVLAIVQLVERGGKLALVEDAEMEHHHASGLGTLYKKYWRRTTWTLAGQQGYFRRASKMA